MRFKLGLLLFGVCLSLSAQMKMSVAQLVTFIDSAIQLKQPDKEVAAYLRKVAMSERLDGRTVEELQGQGAGPKTVEALEALRDASAGLHAAPVRTPTPSPTPTPIPIPPPSLAEQNKIIEQARDYALNYTKNLPNFLCTQVTRRYYDRSGGEAWHQADVMMAKVSYVDQHENYKVTLANGHAVTEDISILKLGGTTSEGEFGSMMHELFDPATEADFGWDHWGKLRGRVAYVFRYRISQPRSKVSVDYDNKEQTTPGYHGLVYVDRDLQAVLRIIEILDMPESFPIKSATRTLDYDLAAIGSQQYMLPLKAEVKMKDPEKTSKNDVEFRLYRKFTAESAISYDVKDTPEPLPEDQTKEQK
jgi:hypothetical protein